MRKGYLVLILFRILTRYLKERKQFGAPLAAFQINQEKLVRMLGNVQAMVLIGWRLCKLYEAGKMTPGHASMGKSWITLRARETVALGRELLGGNGILSDFLVAKAFGDLEPIYTFEGTYDIIALVTGREVTGIASAQLGSNHHRLRSIPAASRRPSPTPNSESSAETASPPSKTSLPAPSSANPPASSPSSSSASWHSPPRSPMPT